jgi:hypothetical protein
MQTREITKFRKEYKDYCGPFGAQGLALAVTFDEKDEVKGMGGKWNPAPDGQRGGYWSMKKSQLGDAAIDWLNEHKMIVGPEGDISGAEAKRYMDEDPTATHRIRKAAGTEYQTFNIYEHFVALQYDENHTMFISHAKAREMWELSMNDGWRLIMGGVTPEPATT